MATDTQKQQNFGTLVNTVTIPGSLFVSEIEVREYNPKFTVSQNGLFISTSPNSYLKLSNKGLEVTFTRVNFENINLSNKLSFGRLSDASLSSTISDTVLASRDLSVDRYISIGNSGNVFAGTATIYPNPTDLASLVVFTSGSTQPSFVVSAASGSAISSRTIRVGIGTPSSIGAVLHISGSQASEKLLYIQNSSGTIPLTISSSGETSFISTRFSITGNITSSGNISSSGGIIVSSSAGVGISNLDGNLDVYSKLPQVDWDPAGYISLNGGDVPNLILAKSHSLNTDAIFGYAGPILEFRCKNKEGFEWPVAQIVGVSDPQGVSNYRGGLAFLTSAGGSGGGAAWSGTRKTKGGPPRTILFLGANGDISASGNISASGLKIFNSVTASGIRIESSTVSGYVLTSDANGTGTWQVAPGGGTSYWSSNIANEIFTTASSVTIGNDVSNKVIMTGSLFISHSSAGNAITVQSNTGRFTKIRLAGNSDQYVDLYSSMNSATSGGLSSAYTLHLRSGEGTRAGYSTRFLHGVNEVMRVSSSANNSASVGIGTTTPQGILHLDGGGNLSSTVAAISSSLNIAGTLFMDGNQIETVGVGGLYIQNGNTAQNVYLATGGGSVGIFSTVLPQRLTVAGNISSSGYMFMSGCIFGEDASEWFKNGDRILFLGSSTLNTATGYAIGTEYYSSTAHITYRSNTNHYFYIGALPDGGISAKFKISPTINVSNNEFYVLKQPTGNFTGSGNYNASGSVVMTHITSASSKAAISDIKKEYYHSKAMGGGGQTINVFRYMQKTCSVLFADVKLLMKRIDTASATYNDEFAFRRYHVSWIRSGSGYSYMNSNAQIGSHLSRTWTGTVHNFTVATDSASIMTITVPAAASASAVVDIEVMELYDQI